MIPKDLNLENHKHYRHLNKTIQRKQISHNWKLLFCLRTGFRNERDPQIKIKVPNATLSKVLKFWPQSFGGNSSGAKKSPELCSLLPTRAHVFRIPFFFSLAHRPTLSPVCTRNSNCIAMPPSFCAQQSTFGAPRCCPRPIPPTIISGFSDEERAHWKIKSWRNGTAWKSVACLCPSGENLESLESTCRGFWLLVLFFGSVLGAEQPKSPSRAQKSNGKKRCHIAGAPRTQEYNEIWPRARCDVM